MKKVELHAKTKYSIDKDSTIDIEAILWNAKENGEKGIVFVDKDSIVAFTKIEKIYKKLCERDETFKNFKIGYGVQLTSIIENIESEVVILVKKQQGLKDLYKIISIYLDKYNKKISINEILNCRDNLLIGIMLNEDNLKVDLSMFDYIELNNSNNISKIEKEFKNKIIYSNIPNSLFEGELKAKEVLYFHQKIDKVPECRLYLDTEDTLKEFNAKEIVITNSNMIFDNLDKIIINDERFYATHIDNFEEFEILVRNNFKKTYKNPSNDIMNRLNKELKLIKQMDYTYVYILLMIITKYCKSENEYYQLDGYINNSLVAYILKLTEIEPFNLPYELFFSEIPKLEIIISPRFYNEKMISFIMKKFENELIRCNYQFKLNKKSIPRVLKHYEIKKKQELNLSMKDYICNILEDVPLYKESRSHLFYFIPKKQEIIDFTPYEIGTTFSNDKLKGTHFDYYDLRNNLISIQFILNDDFKNITNLINKTNKRVDFCNDKKVFNLFRNTEEFDCKFNILDKSNGTLNIRFFSDNELENRLMNIPNIWIDDLEKILMSINHGIVKDDLYNNLKKRSLDDVDIFNVINCLKEDNKLLVSKAFILNKIRLAYMQMYYKLYYPIEYYDEMLFNIDYQFIYNGVYSYSLDNIKKRYFELKETKKLDLDFQEYEELKLLEILIEMYERKIKYSIIDKKIIIGYSDNNIGGNENE